MHVERDRRPERHGVDTRAAIELLREDLLCEVGDLALLAHQVVLFGEALELVGELCGALEPIRCFLCKRLLKNLVEVVGDVWQALFERRHRVHDDRTHRGGFGLAPVERAPGDRLEDANPEGENVEAMIGLSRSTLFRRHVRKLALDHASLGLVRSMVGLGDTEIEQLHRAVVRDHDVVRRNVAVDDVERLAVLIVGDVCVVKRARHVDADAKRNRKSHATGLARLANETTERHAIDPLHHDEVRALVGTELVKLTDVRMLELHPNLRLVEEHLNEVLVLLEVRKDSFDYQVAVIAVGVRVTRE